MTLFRSSLARLAAVAAAIMFALGLVLGAQESRPTRLLQASDLVHQGSFTLPNAQDTTGTYGFEYAQGVIAFNPARNSLFVVGHDWNQQVAEVSIPAIGGTATVLQPFVDALGGRITQINPSDPNAKKIGGMAVIGDRLVLTAYSYYDGAMTASSSHFVRPVTLPASGLQGPFRVGALNPGFYAGYFAPVPAAWQAALGGTLLNGQCCLGIVSRTSYGPSVSVVNPADLTAARANTPATMLVGYPEAHATLAAWASTGPLFNGTTIMRGVVLPEGTATMLFFGRHGMGTWCYGEPTTCKDPEDSGKGTHAYPYEPHVWAYNANDLAAVRSGAKQPWDVKPYATFRLPGLTKAGIGGVTVDPATGRIFVAEQFGDGAKLRIHVFTVRDGGTAPPPPPVVDPPPTPEPPPVVVPPPAPAPTGWVQTWADEFDGTAIDTTRWNVTNSSTSTYGGTDAYYRPQNVVVGGGTATLWARRESFSGKSYTSGAITSQNKWTVGPDDFRIEVRADLPTGAGVWPAIWTREGTMPSPDTGVEVDIVEFLGHEPTRIYEVQHVWQQGTHLRRPAYCDAWAPNGQTWVSGFHTYGFEREGGTMRWLIDGEVRCTSTQDLPVKPSYLMINVSLGGAWPNITVPLSSSTPMPQAFVIDYVRLYGKGSLPPADTDGDGVSDATDQCPALPGLAPHGCQPVDAVMSTWSDWTAGGWSECANGQQSRTETRTRTVVTAAQYGGATPALSETRTVSQACVPPPPPPPPVVLPVISTTMAATQCRLTVSADRSPDGTTGWGVQFRRSGTNIGSRDTAAPYTQIATVPSGSYAIEAVWTKSGAATLTQAVGTVTCGP